MKKIVFLLALATVTLWTTARAQTEAEITYQDFYDGLAPYGDWVYVDGYGYCWQPGVEEGWRPYTNGGWIYTNAGWTWSSDEEWGWATDHYGRWMLTTEFGWLWVPGYEWAPAWVSWRKSDEYVGWAPLPPEATWQPASGFGPSVDVSFSIGPQYYNFCPSPASRCPTAETLYRVLAGECIDHQQHGERDENHQRQQRHDLQ